MGWVALLPAFGYGFLEATLHGIFPVYGLRIGHDIETLSLIIPCFAAGSVISQLPLGMLSDRFGRKNILIGVLSAGTVCFFLAAFLESSVIALFILFTLAGIFVGSLFSLSISYLTDILPRSLLPTGSIMTGISFSIGSITGPFLGGLFIQLIPGVSFFYVIVFMLLCVLAATTFKKQAH